MQNHSNNIIEEIEYLCNKIFKQSKDGERLHELLCEFYIKRMPVFNLGAKNPESYAAMREGNNALIRQLLTFANQHEIKLSKEGGKDGGRKPSTTVTTSTTAIDTIGASRPRPRPINYAI